MAAMRARILAPLLTAGLLAGAAVQAQGESSDDDVFDNTKLNEQLAQDRAKKRREKYQGDSPFAADEAPDKVEKREERFSPGMQGGYRAGWAIPTGNHTQGRRFTENQVGMIFLWGDGGYQPIPELMVGMYLSGGYVIPDCDGDASCTFWDLRAGIQAQWRFLPFADLTPWVGIGAGWELMLWSATDPLDNSTTTTLHGPELFNVQGGLDIWAPTARGHAGLFLAYSMGRFISASVSAKGESHDLAGFEPANHGWIFIGARGTF
jgi:hypothetical protein